MNWRFPAILGLVVLGCASPRTAKKEFELVPGRKPPQDARVSPVTSVHRGNFCAQHVEYRGHSFSIDRPCGQRTITYVQTFDRSFATPEGVSVGDSVAEAASAGGVLDSSTCIVSLPSGWVAHGIDGDCSSAKIWLLDFPPGDEGPDDAENGG